ncbi:MAG: polysaccharide biosynthesis tyrosine autokinase [Acidobacteriia bacterium]|nr:polysaccharide biosynthesis tyrosine autokinase [Terriglobia bacterium]
MKSLNQLEGPASNLARAERGGVPAMQTLIDVPYTAVDDRSEWARFADLGRLLSRRKRFLMFAVSLGLIGGAAATHWTTPVYRSSTSLEVQGLNEDFLDLRRIDSSAQPANFSAESFVQTQVDILQDDVVLDRVINRLKLPERAGFMPKPGVIAALAGSLPIPQSQQDDNLRPVDILREHLVVAPAPHSRIVRITYESSDPLLAADVVNGLADEFISYNLEARLNAANQVGQWLGPQLEEMKARLAQSEAELTTSSQAAGLLLSAGTESVAEERLRNVQRELATAQGDRISKESTYRMVSESPADSLPAALEPASLKENRAKLTDLRRQRAELSSLYTDDNYRVVRLQAQIDELDAAVQTEIRTIPKKYRSEYQAALGREMMLAKNYNAQAATVSQQARERIRYESLKRALEDNRQIYQSTLQKVKEAGIASAIKPSGVRIIGAATAPVRPFRPNAPLNLGLGLLSGLCLGLVGAATIDRSKRVVRVPGELRACVNVPELGAIPSGTYQSLYATPRRMLLDTRPQVSMELATWQEKHSPISESFREVLASLMYSGSIQSLLVTSAAPMEGKTTIVSNLAIALAEIGKRVLLIDGDLRKPRLHEIFDQPNTWGLSTVLAEKDSIQELPVSALVRKTSIPGLSLLPAGPSTEQISTLLYSSRMQDLMTHFRQDFDYVFLDAPPVLRFSDARVLGHAADAVIIVARANKTAPDTVREAAARFQMVGIPVFGTILNDCDQRVLGQYGYGYQYR